MIWPPVAQAIIDYAAENGVAGAVNRSAGQVVAGMHAAGSYHYVGQAVDFGLLDSDAARVESLFAPLAQGPDPLIVELFGVGGSSFKNGAVLSPEPSGHAGNHTHVAGRLGLSLADLRAAAGGRSGVPTATLIAATHQASWLSPKNVWRLLEGLLGGAVLVAGLIMLSNRFRSHAAGVV